MAFYEIFLSLGEGVFGKRKMRSSVHFSKIKSMSQIATLCIQVWTVEKKNTKVDDAVSSNIERPEWEAETGLRSKKFDYELHDDRRMCFAHLSTCLNRIYENMVIWHFFHSPAASETSNEKEEEHAVQSSQHLENCTFFDFETRVSQPVCAFHLRCERICWVGCSLNCCFCLTQFVDVALRKRKNEPLTAV